MNKRLISLIIMMVLILTSYSLAGKMTAEKIIKNCVNSYDQQMKDVKDVKIIDTQGTIYKKFVGVGGKKVFKVRYEDKSGMIYMFDGKYQWMKNPFSGKVTKEKRKYAMHFEMIDMLKNVEFEFVGTEDVDGIKTYVLKSYNLDDFIVMPIPTEGQLKAIGKVWIDSKIWMVRKMEIDIESTDGGEGSGMKIAGEINDYRKIKGIWIPYDSSSEVDINLGDMLKDEDDSLIEETSIEELEGAMNQIKDMDFSMLPKEQRKMMEQMIKSTTDNQASKKNNLNNSKHVNNDGSHIKVKEVKINAGLSDDLFNGKKL